jgi:CheY-like chemotaxis protein
MAPANSNPDASSPAPECLGFLAARMRRPTNGRGRAHEIVAGRGRSRPQPADIARGRAGHAACSLRAGNGGHAHMSIVLVVDDVNTDRALIGKVVSDTGHQPIYAANGKEALQAARAHKPALILLDVVMPDMNGFNVCRSIKGDASTGQIPVILVTTKGTDSDRFWGRKQGAEDHLAKPFAPEELAALIRRHVR